jgi:hypothetical protein
VKGGLAGSDAQRRRGGSSFAQVLDEVARAGDSDWRLSRTLGHLFDTIAPPTRSDAGAEFPTDERWDQALDWIEAPQEAASAPKPAALPSADPDAIAAEIGLTRALTHEELKRARRRFMWNNHPDRRPDVPRELANRRVAIANMLFDKAQQALTPRRSAP